MENFLGVRWGWPAAQYHSTIEIGNGGISFLPAPVYYVIVI